MSGHGRTALERTTLMRYTLRAYLDAGLSPRTALRLGGHVLDGEISEEFATVVVAVYDPGDAMLSYACAGHPPPVVLGPARHEPVTAYSSPPLGVEVPTGLRQTTLSLPAGSLACFYTDGLTEARTGGRMIGRDRLAELIEEVGPGISAQALLDRLAREADQTPDDMAACVIQAVEGSAKPLVRVEELELEATDVELGAVEGFLEACGVPGSELSAPVSAAREAAGESGGAILRARFEDGRPEVAVVPPTAEGLVTAAVSPSAVRPTPVTHP
jgi:hypothetical protein